MVLNVTTNQNVFQTKHLPRMDITFVVVKVVCVIATFLGSHQSQLKHLLLAVSSLCFFYLGKEYMYFWFLALVPTLTNDLYYYGIATVIVAMVIVTGVVIYYCTKRHKHYFNGVNIFLIINVVNIVLKFFAIYLIFKFIFHFLMLLFSGV